MSKGLLVMTFIVGAAAILLGAAIFSPVLTNPQPIVVEVSNPCCQCAVTQNVQPMLQATTATATPTPTSTPPAVQPTRTRPARDPEPTKIVPTLQPPTHVPPTIAPPPTTVPPTDEPQPVPTKKHCDKGEGNGHEGCDPGGNPDHGNDDED